MFFFAILTGFLGIVIFFLGVTHTLSSDNISLCVIFYVFLLSLYLYKILDSVFLSVARVIGGKKDALSILVGIVGLVQIIVNLIGALGPEYAFDAVWYHLTFPKLYLAYGGIDFFPGSIMYYAAMPKLTEMLYIPALLYSNEITAKSFHFLFGLLTCVALYQCSRTIFMIHRRTALFVIVIFISNLVFAWESTTAYIDLTRTFYEFLALWAFLLWVKKGKKSWLFVSALMVGFASSTKLLALGSLGIFTFLIAYHARITKMSFKSTLMSLLGYWITAFLVVAPWFIFSYIHTGNPVYPFFSDMYKTSFGWSLLSPFLFFQDIVRLMLFADDPISPLYCIFLPCLFWSWKSFSQNMKIVVLYAIGALLLWYITPRSGGGRFILPYLPSFSLTIVFIYMVFYKNRFFRIIWYVLVLLIAFITIVYRGYTNSKYVPFITGKVSKQAFLSHHLNFSYGDFYDIDGYFQKKIKDNDRVLLYGFHNMYYVDFPFTHSTWIRKGDTFNYIATQHTDVPLRFKLWEKVYENKITGVKLYTDNMKMHRY